MNPGSRDTPTEEKAPRLGSGDGHVHSKAGGSLAMHDHGRRSPASAHSPGMSAKLSSLHPGDSGRSSRGFGVPGFSAAGLPPGLNLEHLPFLFNPFLYPSTGSLFPPVLPPNFLPPPPPLQPPLASLFPSPNAECETSSGGWSAHSGRGSRNTSSLGSSSSEGDTAAKVDSRTVRSSRCSPDVNLQPTSLSSGVRKMWDSSVIDPVCISDADMPLSLVTRRETTSRGSSAAESGVCTGDSLARAASSDASRTPSLDGESGCHPVNENSSVQDQTVTGDQPTQWPASKVATETLQAADDGKSSAGDDVWGSSAAASRSSGIALPPRKRLTRNAEELSSSVSEQSVSSSVAAGSPSSAPNFRSCWKKFAAKSNVSGPTLHRSFGSKPQYDCRTYFQKLAEQARAAAASRAFVPGKGKGHCYRNANKASPRSSDQNTGGSPRVTRSQSKPKKSQSPKSSPSEPPAPVRKSTRKKSINTRFEEYDRTVGKNKKLKSLSLESSATASDADKETPLAAGDEVTASAEKNSQRKNRRRGKQAKGEFSTDADVSSMCGDTEDSMSQSQLDIDALLPVSEPDSKPSGVASSLPAMTHEGSDLNARMEDAVDPEPSPIVTVWPPKFRHFRTKAAAVTVDSSHPPTNSDQPVTTPNESSNLEVAASVRVDSTDSTAVVVQSVDVVAEEGEDMNKSGLPTLTENNVSAETAVSSLAEESKVSQSHSVGGRKSLLYRSGTTIDSQLASEAKLGLTSSQPECSGSLVADAVSDVSVDRTLADEKSDKRIDLSEDASAGEHSKVLSEQNQVLLDSTEPEVATANKNKKVQDNTDDGLSQPHTESVSVTSSDIVPCTSSLAAVDVDLKASTVLSAVSNMTSDHPSADTSEESESSGGLESGVNTVIQRLDGGNSVPADSLNECESRSKIEPCAGSGYIAVMSCSQSVQSQSTESAVCAAAGVLNEPRSSTTPVTAATETSDLSCRTKPADVSGSSVEEAQSQNGDSLKRLLSDGAPVSDGAKRRRVGSLDYATDRLSVDALSQPLNNTATTNTAINLISSSGEQTCHVPNNKSYTVTAGKLQSSSSTSIQITLKPERIKPDRSKSTKANRRPKANRSYRALKNAAIVDRSVLQKSNNSTDETTAAESELNTNNEKYDPSLLEIPDSGTTGIVKYAVANSVDKMCDTNTDVHSTQNSNEQKTLRISLVAINESNTPLLRVKDSRTEGVCNSDKMLNSSPAVPVYTAATAAVNNLDQLETDGSLVDAEPLVDSADVSQDSLTLERDRSALLSQCKALSVVLEKMRNNNNASLPDSLSKPTGRRRRGGLLHYRINRLTKPDVSANDSLPVAENLPASEPLVSASVDDAYKFPDDAVSDSLPLQRVPRPERKTLSRKARSVQPTADQVELSPAAASDSSSRGAASSVDSPVVSAKSGVRSSTPNAVQKVAPVRPETGTVRPRRRRHALQQDEDTRSLSPFENGSLPAPVVEASLDGHKLKLRIIANRSTEASVCDAKVPVPPSSSVELPGSGTKPDDDEVQTPDREPPPVVEVTTVPASRRRRQLKVEGVRSRFLTLHKPSGVAPSADHVKCRLVKVGRRHWMSIGGEEADEDSSVTQQSDAETPAKNSPAASSLDEMAQHPTRDRLLLVNERTRQHSGTGRQRQSPKAKAAGTTDTNSLVLSTKRTKKRVKTLVSRLEASSPKPEPLPEVVVSRPARVDPVPWLDCETDSSEMQPYSVLGDSSSRTIATDLDEYRLRVSTPAEFTSDTDLVISDALSDCGVELACRTVLAPRSMYFVPSELERLMEDLVLDSRRRQTRTCTPPVTVAAHETHILSSASIGSASSYSNGALAPVFSPQFDGELDRLISQPSLRPQNCMLPVDAYDSSDYDCTIVGYEYPAHSYPDSVELPSLFDHQLIDEDCLLSAPLSDTQLYSCVDFVL